MEYHFDTSLGSVGLFIGSVDWFSKEAETIANGLVQDQAKGKAMKKWTVLALGMVLVGTVGCGSKTIVGKWTGSIVALPQSDKDTEADKAAKAMALARSKMVKIEQEFRSDGTFAMATGPGPETRGTWTLDGDKLTLTSGGKSGTPATVVFDGSDKFTMKRADAPTVAFERASD